MLFFLKIDLGTNLQKLPSSHKNVKSNFPNNFLILTNSFNFFGLFYQGIYKGMRNQYVI